ncbi:kinase-like domain-containing protein [Rhizophagus irregularis DAOM 181602=DAOM 197198]|nr:kinase-like domain-containing protein [Rhizophagus irregularis DAOM 181602=DAOM 197198]
MRSKYLDVNYENFPVALKCLHNSQDITSEFLRETELHIMINSDCVTKCFVASLYRSSRHSDDHKIKKQIEEADKINEKISESTEAIDFTKLNLDENN